MGQFLVERRLGRGGMATVYLGQDQAGTPVAIKVMLPQLASEASFLERFLREVEATRSLTHKNVVQVLGAGEQDGLPYLVCEYVEGGSLETMLEECPRLALDLALEIGVQLFEGLAHAHQQGIIHRDLKPANLLLTTGGVLKVADFGVAKVAGASSLTRTGALFGTPAYMSPEQAQGLHVDARSDLFSAGVIVYELLTGINPHKTEDPSAALLRVQLGVPPIAELDPTVPPEVEVVIEKLLEREPDARYQSAVEALGALLPLVAEVRGKQPGLLAEALLDPVGVSRRLRMEQAERFRLRARQLFAESSFLPAALWLSRAVTLDPENEAAQKLFAQVCQRESLSFAPSVNPKIAELEGAVAKGPDNAKALLQLAQLFRLEGNVAKAVAQLKRVLRLRPSDAYVASQLSQLTGERFAVRQSSTDLAQGIDTGGHVAQARARPVGREPLLPVAGQSTGIERLPDITEEAALPSAASGPQRRPAAPIAVSLPREAVEPIAAASTLELFWRAYGKRLATVVAVVLVLGWAVRRVGRMIERATSETDRATAELRAGIQGGNQALAGASTGPEGAALRARLEQGMRDAASKLEAASALFRRGSFLEAVQVCDALIDRYPKLPEATEAAFLRARALLLAGRDKEALEALSRFASEHRGSAHYAEALLRAGEANLKLHDAKDALPPLDELVRSLPDSPFATEGYLFRARALADNGDALSAEADYRIVIGRTGPADPLHASAREALKKLPPTKIP